MNFKNHRKLLKISAVIAVALLTWRFGLSAEAAAKKLTIYSGREEKMVVLSNCC